jgi:hypothetical protein
MLRVHKFIKLSTYAPVIRRCNWAVSLLTSSVPYLSFDKSVVLDLHSFGWELNADGRLRVFVELVFREAEDNVWFAYTRVCDKQMHQRQAQLLPFSNLVAPTYLRWEQFWRRSHIFRCPSSVPYCRVMVLKKLAVWCLEIPFAWAWW